MHSAGMNLFLQSAIPQPSTEVLTGYLLSEVDLLQAFLIIPTSFLVLFIYTICFPLIAIRLVRQNLPCVDPYNDSGEIRTEIKEEYNRLMNSDSGPYNFLYNVTAWREKLMTGIYHALGIIQSIHPVYAFGLRYTH